jgi:hypothetical protein
MLIRLLYFFLLIYLPTTSKAELNFGTNVPNLPLLFINADKYGAEKADELSIYMTGRCSQQKIQDSAPSASANSEKEKQALILSEACMYPKLLSAFKKAKVDLATLVAGPSPAVKVPENWNVLHLRAGLWRLNPFSNDELTASEIRDQVLRYIILQEVTRKSLSAVGKAIDIFDRRKTTRTRFLVLPLVATYFESGGRFHKLLAYSSQLDCGEVGGVCVNIKAVMSKAIVQASRPIQARVNNLIRALGNTDTKLSPWQNLQAYQNVFELEKYLNQVRSVDWQKTASQLLKIDSSPNGNNSESGKRYVEALSTVVARPKPLNNIQTIQEWTSVVLISQFQDRVAQIQKFAVEDSAKDLTPPSAEISEAVQKSAQEFEQNIFSIEKAIGADEDGFIDLGAKAI